MKNLILMLALAATLASGCASVGQSSSYGQQCPKDGAEPLCEDSSAGREGEYWLLDRKAPATKGDAEKKKEDATRAEREHWLIKGS